MVTRGLLFSNTLLTDGIDITNGYFFEKPGSRWDFSRCRRGFSGPGLARTFAFTQPIKGTVGFEAFNRLNRQHATAVNAIAYYSVAPLPPGLIKGPQFGTMTRSPASAREFAAQAFPDGINARRCQLAFRVVF
jgi:hypothetical protein